MTEDEWLKCEDSETMLEFIRPLAPKRKLQLFAAACFRRLSHLLPDDRQMKAVEMLEDTSAGMEMREIRSIVKGTWHAMPSSEECFGEIYKDRDKAYIIALMLYRELASQSTAHHAAHAARGLADGGVAERKIQSQILRCIVGPLAFRAVSIDSAWATPAIHSLAQSIDNSRDFHLLPQLGQAIQQAGCNDRTILEHCNDPGLHVKGCWIIDSLLMKQ